MSQPPSPESIESRLGKFYYFTGFLTAGLIFLVLFLLLGYRIGFSGVLTTFGSLWPTAPYKHLIYLPDEILNELIADHGVIDKAGNPTRQPAHNTIVVQPDKDLGYVLKPNIEISASILKSIDAFNFAPPALYLRTNSVLSPRLKNYLKVQSRLDYSFSIDAHGFRKTIPAIDADKKILLVGDSVPFGIGVDDEFTIASWLQKRAGNQFAVINAGVGGYDGRQAFQMAKKLGATERYSCLIYVACQNDFMESRDWVEEEKNVLEKIHSIAGQFQGHVVIFFHTYMEYCLHDIFLEKGWEKGFTEKTDSLRAALPALCRAMHFECGDWTEIVNHFQKKNKSIFSRFALYADHCHLSPLGNRLAAESLFDSLKELKLVE